MKTILNIKISALLIGLLATGSCDKDSGTFPDGELSAITKVEGPVTAKAGQEVLIKVTLQGSNGCAVSGELKEIVSGNIRTVAGKVHYKGEICTQATVTLNSDYSFIASTPGTYELKFLKYDETYLNHTIKVE